MNIVKKFIYATLLGLSALGLTVSLPIQAQPTPSLISITIDPASAVTAVDQVTWFTATGTYSNGASRILPATKGYLTSTVLEDGKVLITGGYDGNSAPMTFDEADIYDPTSGTFSRTGAMTIMRDSHTATRLTDGKVLVTGGFADVPAIAEYGPIGSAELYNPTTGSFKATGSMSESRAYHTSTLLANGKVLIIGGYSGLAGTLATAELYDPASGTFSATGSMSIARDYHTATPLANGKVLIVGGGTDIVELYNPATGTFSNAGSMSMPRYAHTATLLTDGRVLVAGGWWGTGLATAAELYDPATDTFSMAGSMLAPRTWHTATLLTNGQVLLAGAGADFAELYDPATDTFSATGIMEGWRYDFTAALLGNGDVLVVGGSLPMAELYNTQTGGWQDAGYNLGDPLVWSNSDSAVATAGVGSDGWYYLTGLLPGTTTITATSGSISGSAQVKVGYAPTAFVAGQVVAPGEIVQLNGSATDSDGYIASYVWYQSYGVPVTLSNDFVASPSFTAPPYTPGGDYWSNFLGFQFSATDNDGLMATTYASVQIVEPTTSTSPTTSSTTSTSGGSTTTITVTSTTTTTGIPVNCGGNVGCADANNYCAGCHGVIVNGIQAAGSGGRTCVQRTHTEWTATIERMNGKGCGVPAANIAGIASYLANLAPIDTTTTTTSTTLITSSTSTTTTTSGGSTTTVASTTTTTLPVANCGSDVGCADANHYCVGCHGVIVNGIQAAGSGGKNCVQRSFTEWSATIERMNGKGCGVPAAQVAGIASYLANLAPIDTTTTTTSTTSTTTTTSGGSTTTVTSTTTTTGIPVNCGSNAGCQAASSYCVGCHNGITVNGYAVGGNGRTCVSRGYQGWVTTIERMNLKGCGVPSSLVPEIATYLTSLESPYGGGTTTTSGGGTTTTSGGGTTTSKAPTTTTMLTASSTAATTTSTVATTTTTTVCNTHVNGTTNYPYSGTGSCHGHGDNNNGDHTVREEKWCQQHMDHFNNAGNHTHASSHPVCM